MPRISVAVSSLVLLTASAAAQCLLPATGAPASLVPWDNFSGFTSTWPADDEGITNAITLTAFPSFPMVGAVGTLDRMFVHSNGHIYLVDSTQFLSAPVGGQSYEWTTLGGMRGGIGGSARIVPFGDDLEASGVAGASWGVTVDQTVPGQVRVCWTDVGAYPSSVDRFSFSTTLHASGVVEFSYGAGIAGGSRYVGISIGNDVGSTASPSRDLTATADSGTEGMLYELFTTTSWDLAGRTVLLSPNGTGGYISVVTCEPANHTAYGAGCYDIAQPNSVYQLFADAPSAKAALDGNGMLYVLNGQGYSANWIPGFAVNYVPPTGAATSFPVSNDGTFTITPSVPIPVPGGVASAWTVSMNGILTAAATGNNGGDWTPTGPEMVGTAAPNLGFYCWHDYNPAEVGSGPVQHEEIAGVLYVTWNGVECYGTPSPNLATWQFQVDMTTGNVTLVWVSMDPSTVGASSGDDTLVGCTLAGVGVDPGTQVLSTTLPVSLSVDILPLTLSASPAPVINPSTVVTYTIANVPEFAPGAGVHLATLFLSLGSLPGVDLGILGAPGCNAYIAALDLNISVAPSLTPTATTTVTFSDVFFAPGNVVYAQAVALFDPAFPLPNGQNAFGLTVSNGVMSTTHLN
jgi:hypothetical protein